MALSGNISSAAGVTGNKDLVKAYQPLLLCVFTWLNPSGGILDTLRLSTHPLNAAEGGFQYGGQDYFARLLDQNIDAVQAMSDTGIDIPPTLTLQIADADRFIWSNYENNYGFKGALLKVSLVLWEADTANFSADSLVKFIGYCNPGNLSDETTISVSAGSKLNMQKVLLPVLPIQQRCPWIFPPDLASRTHAHSDPDSPYFECGYSFGVAGGQGIGNGFGQPFTTCDYTKAACQARGMYAGPIGHFGGVQWAPPLWWKSKSYLEGKTVSGINSINEAKYGDYVPMVYGKTFISPIVLNVIGDANSTRMEVMCCFGNVGNASASGSTGGVQMVIVNDVAIPFNYQSVGGAHPADVLFRWNYVNFGNRDSSPNGDAGYTDSSHVPLGDPYGNLCVIEIVIPKSLGDSSSIPGVRVLLTGPQLRVYSNPSTFTLQTTSNPVWVLMDLLIQSNWLYADLNIQSFIDAAAVCDVSIAYTDNSGSSSSHARYSCSLALQQRRSAADIIRGVRNACKAMLVPNDTTGLLQIFIKQTLADQQSTTAYPSGIPGSNNAGAVASILANGSAANGVSAYDFDETSILLKDDGSSTLSITQRAILNSPNRISVNFQDQDNQWVSDSITEVDPTDILRAGQEVVNGVQADGINTYDQGKRIFEGIFAETYRGNSRGDSGGTLVFQFATSQKVAHLHVGHICQFSHTQLGIIAQMVRVISIQPSRDHESVKIALQWHDDRWYKDTYGQAGDPIYSGPGKEQLARPPFRWQPDQEAPLASDLVFGPTNYTFGMAQSYEENLDGTSNATLTVTGRLPVNSFLGAASQPPLIGLQGTHTPGGGTGGGTPASTVCYLFVAPYDAAGLLGPPTRYPCVVAIPSTDANNSVTVPVKSWPPGASGWYVFGGTDPLNPTFQGTGGGTPSSITITTPMNVRAYGPPDVMFDHLELRVKRQIHGGVWGAAVSAVTATTLQFAGSTFSVNQWAGYDLTITGRNGLSTSLPVWNLRIASNTADTLTVAGGTGNLTTLPSADIILHGINVNDVAVMRALPSTFTSTTLGDANFVNNIDGGGGAAGLADESAQNYILRIYAGTGAGQWRKVVSNSSTVYTVSPPFDNVPDATSRFWIESSDFITLAKSSPLPNQDPAAVYTGTAGISDYNGESIVVEGVVLDANGNEGIERDCPIRDFYIFGSAGSIASSIPPTPVAITSIAYDYIWPADAVANAGQPTNLRLTLKYTVLPGWTGTGVHVYAEYPDQSSSAAYLLDGSHTLNGTTQLGGSDWNLIDLKQQPDDGTRTVIITSLAIPTAQVVIRIYLDAYNSTVDPPVIRANAAIGVPTPSIALLVKTPDVVQGVEYAKNVTNLVATPTYSLGASGQLVLLLNVSWTNPDDANFSTVWIILSRPPGTTGQLVAPPGTRTALLQANLPALMSWSPMVGAESFVAEISSFPTKDETTDTVQMISVNAQGFPNTYVRGVTPEYPVTLLAPPSGNSGMEKTPVGGVPSASITYGVNGDGGEYCWFNGNVSPPVLSDGVTIDPTFAGYRVFLRRQIGPGTIDPDTGIAANDINISSTDSTSTTYTTAHVQIQSTTPAFDMYFLAYDVNGQSNKLVPGVTQEVANLTPTLQTTGKMKAHRLDPTTLDPSMAIISLQLAIANSGVTSAKMAALSVTAAALANSSVTAVAIANLAVGTAAIALLSVGTAQIALLSITNALIANATITDAKISDLSATKITAGTISAVTITTATINGGAITGTSLSLTAGGSTTTINNASSAHGVVGLIVQNTSASQPAAMVIDSGHYVRAKDNSTFIGQLAYSGSSDDGAYLVLSRTTDSGFMRLDPDAMQMFDFLGTHHTDMTGGSISGTDATGTWRLRGDGISAPSGGLVLKSRTVIAADTMTNADYAVYGDTTSGAFSIKLPASPQANQIHLIDRVAGGNNLTLDGNGHNIRAVSTALVVAQISVQFVGSIWQF